MSIVSGFKVNRRVVIQSAVQAPAVVKDFDEFEDSRLGLSVGLKFGAIDQLVLERAPEGFYANAVGAIRALLRAPPV